MSEVRPEKNTKKGAVQGLRDIYTNNSTYNSLEFIIRMFLNNNLSTAMPVKVVAVEAGGSKNSAGYVDVLPLVCSTDAEGNTINPTVIYHLPYNRVQGGKAAIVVDPCLGDIGLCVFCKQDASNVTAGTTQPQQPGSFRAFDMADGFYFGGFLNQPPEVYLELTQDGKVMIEAKNGLSVNGNVTVQGDVIANGISLTQHRHGGVQSGGSTTGQPV